MHPTGNYQKIVVRTSRVHGWSCLIPLSSDVFAHWGQNPLLTYWNWTRHVLHPEIYLSKTPKGIKSLESKKCHLTKSRSLTLTMSVYQGTSSVFSIRKSSNQIFKKKEEEKTDTNRHVFSIFKHQFHLSPGCVSIPKMAWGPKCDSSCARTRRLQRHCCWAWIQDPVFQDHGGVCWKFI